MLLTLNLICSVTERNRPSLRTGGGKEHGIPFNLNAQTTRAIMCSECLRPRVIYVQYKLIHAEEVALYRTKEGLFYTRGSTLKGVQVATQSRTQLSIVKDLFGKVYVQENITCNDQRFQSVCTHCACVCDVDIEGQYPLCAYCRQQGKLPIFKRKRKLQSK